MTTKEKHKWLLDNYSELTGFSEAQFLFLKNLDKKLEILYKKTAHTFDFVCDETYEENEMILLINLLYHKLKK